MIQVLAKRHAASITQRIVSLSDGRPAGVYGDYEGGAQTIRLLMPLTMMNESGEALKAVGVSPSELLVVCDDVNLPLGTIRLRPQGGAGGHHGLQSCLEVLETEDVARLRIGVGVAPLPSDLREFVLSPFGSAERPVMKESIERAAAACEAWSTEGIEVAMNRYNTVEQT